MKEVKDHKVKATRLFNDAVEGKERKAGDIFKCTKERYLYLKSKNNAVELVEEPATKLEEVTITINTDFNVPAEALAEAIEKQTPKKKTTRTTKINKK